MKKLILLLFLWLLRTGCSAQQYKVSGTVTDANSKQKIPYASVNLLSAENKIIAFKSTNAEGSFTIITARPTEELIMEINHLGYEKFRQQLHKSAADLTVSLIPKMHLLEDVEVRSRPQIRKLGDTLSYNVESFAKEEDRSIGDVIKRIPGMEVSESGQIKYQGKAISNFYIDGDDLLDDRYAIGTRTIPYKMVQDIQVLNNHEHLKVLKNKRFTDQVAINLLIKDDARLKLTGQAKLGGGFPKQYDSELNSILFNKKYKMLNVLNGNNTGKDLTGDLVGYNQASIFSKLGNSSVNNLLSLGTIGPPPISKQQYYFNNTGALNTNNLFNLKNDLQLKSNIQALYDKERKSFRGQTAYYSETGTASFDESQHTETEKFMSAIRLTLSKNIEKKYINNTLSFEYEKQNGIAALLSNAQSIDQNRQHTIRGISNQLSFVPEFKNKHIIELNWSFSYGNKPQFLNIQPGIFPDILNSGQSYSATHQKVEVPTLYNTLSAGYRISKSKIRQLYEAGISNDRQHLRSDLLLRQKETDALQSGGQPGNDMTWLRNKFYVNAQYEWKQNRMEAMLSLPLAYQITSFSDPGFDLKKNRNDVLFNPVFKFKMKVMQEDEISLNYNFSNSFGGITNVYRGLLVRNYRMLSQNESEINESQGHNIGLNYNFNRITKILFVNAGLNYSQSVSNTIISSRVSNNITEEILVPMDNKILAYSGYVGFDKYLFRLASTVKLKVSWNLSDYNQLFNDALLPFRNTSYVIQPGFEAKIWKNYNLSYSGTINWNISRQREAEDGFDRQVTGITQVIGFPVHPFKNTYLRFSMRHHYTHQPLMRDINYTFVDFFARYRIQKWKTDLELDMSNLANIKTFQTYTVSSNMLSDNRYDLRGRMAIVKVLFNL
ncbi:hypothetical protein ACR79T_08795 [Sphingobacterium spiritivorum]|uniref:hypothetical protein n=1 Tax=Sphingobacterium spiritivorum TaxID=258 RepID=UPI003DA3F428